MKFQVKTGGTMKLIQIMIIILIPIHAYGLEIMSDQNLDTVSGQSGIDIFFEGTTKVQVEIGDFIFGDLDGDGSNSAGYFALEGTADPGRQNNDKTILYLKLKDTLFKIDVGASGANGIRDTDSENDIIDNTLFVKPNQPFIKIGLPELREPSEAEPEREPNIVIQFDLPDISEIKFHDASKSLSYSLGNVLMTPLTLKINKIYNDLYISSH
jgi:hypothetical protein